MATITIRDDESGETKKVISNGHFRLHDSVATCSRRGYGGERRIENALVTLSGDVLIVRGWATTATRRVARWEHWQIKFA